MTQAASLAFRLQLSVASSPISQWRAQQKSFNNAFTEINITGSETMHLTHSWQMPCWKPSAFRLRFCVHKSNTRVLTFFSKQD